MYPSDLNEDQYNLIKFLIPKAKTGGRRRTTDTHQVLNAIFYLLRTGCQWRMLPKDFPKWITVYYYYKSWSREGIWIRIYRHLYPAVRQKMEKETTPSIGIIDGCVAKISTIKILAII